MKKIFFILLLATSAFAVSAQEIAVGTAEITDCGAFLVDTGMSSGDYGPNQNLTSTICPDGTDQNLVNLYFNFSGLGAGDFLSFYDGVDANAPLMGTYGTDELQGMDITSTNPDGCLTVVFTSDSDAEVGSFTAEISCHEPCDRPYSAITTDMEPEGPVKVCVGEVITFDGSSSTFAETASYASHTWDFQDGTTDNSTWPVVTHSFDTPGAYIVQLYLTDDNDCSSGNLPDKLIYVATTPEMSLTADDYQVCIGQQVEVDAALTPVNWTSLPTANFGGALFIPDDQNNCFSDTITFGGFSPGASIATESDIENFFINFEHSFMGDITISFICPNGQSIAVHQQGGSGTFLGEPIDNDLDLGPGVGYDYYWAPDATNGTWEENAGGTLPSGTYESVQPFSNLIGCPLNGEWIVEICDSWASDNGFIFDWSVEFAAYLYPDLISFTPTYGWDCDSTYISGQFIVDIDGGCDTALVVPSSAGDFIYTYTAFDDFGCTFSEEISINAYPGPIASAGEDFNFCGEEVQLDGAVTNPVNGIEYIYTWYPSAPLSNANIDDPYLDGIEESQDFVLQIYPLQDPNCVVSDTVNAYIPPVPPSEPLDSLEFCAGSNIPVTAPGVGNNYYYTWFYSADGENYTQQASNSMGEYVVNETGYYYVEVSEPVCDFTAVTPWYVDVIACEIIIPNVFTPNGSGENDTFEIYGLNRFPHSTIRIYNRWGNQVYESDNYYNQWTGDDHSEGTYYFILGVKKGGGYEYHEGHLTLLRN